MWILEADAEHATQEDNNSLINPIDKDHPPGPQVSCHHWGPLLFYTPSPDALSFSSCFPDSNTSSPMHDGFFSFFHQKRWGAFDNCLNAYWTSLECLQHRNTILSRSCNPTRPFYTTSPTPLDLKCLAWYSTAAELFHLCTVEHANSTTPSTVVQFTMANLTPNKNHHQ